MVILMVIFDGNFPSNLTGNLTGNFYCTISIRTIYQPTHMSFSYFPFYGLLWKNTVEDAKISLKIGL